MEPKAKIESVEDIPVGKGAEVSAEELQAIAQKRLKDEEAKGGPSLDDNLMAAFGQTPDKKDEEGAGEGGGEATPTNEGAGATEEKAASAEEKKGEAEDEVTLDEALKDIEGDDTKPATPSPVEDLEEITAKTPMNELRVAYGSLKQKAADLEKAVTEREQAAKQKEEEYAKQLEEAQKRVQALDYTKSKEFEDKYTAPVTDRITQLQEDWKDVAFEVENPETGEKEQRSITIETLSQVYDAPASRKAEVATAVAGPYAASVIADVREVERLNRARMKAVENAETQSVELRKAELAKIEKRNAEYRQEFERAKEGIAAQYPEIFSADTEDKAVSRLLRAGDLLANVAFDPPSDLPVADVAKAQASARLRVQHFARITAQNRELAKKVTKLEKALKKVSGTSPLAGVGGSGDSGSGETLADPGGDNILAALQKQFK